MGVWITSRSASSFHQSSLRAREVNWGAKWENGLEWNTPKDIAEEHSSSSEMFVNLWSMGTMKPSMGPLSTKRPLTWSKFGPGLLSKGLNPWDRTETFWRKRKFTRLSKKRKISKNGACARGSCTREIDFRLEARTISLMGMKRCCSAQYVWTSKISSCLKAEIVSMNY